MGQRITRELRSTIIDALAANVKVSELCEAYDLKPQQVYNVRYSVKAKNTEESTEEEEAPRAKRKYTRRASTQSTIEQSNDSDVDYKKLYFKALKVLIQNNLVKVKF